MIKNQIPDQDFRKIETETEAVKYQYYVILKLSNQLTS